MSHYLVERRVAKDVEFFIIYILYRETRIHWRPQETRLFTMRVSLRLQRRQEDGGKAERWWEEVEEKDKEGAAWGWRRWWMRWRRKRWQGGKTDSISQGAK